MTVVRHIIYYDGDCGFCNRTVQWIMEHDHKGDIYFAALQSAVAKERLSGYKVTIAMDTILLESDGVIYQKSDAILRIISIVGGYNLLVKIGQLIPLRLRTWAYDQIAKNRHRLTSTNQQCKLPTAAQSRRFLDNASGHPL